MIYPARPLDGPARGAWKIFDAILGDMQQLRFPAEFQGDPAGFWRVRFRDQNSGNQRVKIIPAKNLDTVSDDQIAAIRKLRGRGETRRGTGRLAQY
jgi:hypothetical protein